MWLKRVLLCVSAAAGMVVATSVAHRASHPTENTKRDSESSVTFWAGLGGYSRRITTRSDDAQRFFDQGLALLYGFNHDEACRSFEHAAACDPACAMAQWGIAMAKGPHINRPSVDSASDAAAWRAVVRAYKLSDNATPEERSLIKALCQRYTSPPLADRRPLDEAYATAMREAWKTHPYDADIGALSAEALLDLRPWNQWTSDGKAEPGTEEVLQILNDVLSRAPRHPLGLHLLIHALEASPYPEKADHAADILRNAQPGLGHILHMPSHIDVRRGRWQEAVVANESAIAADAAYLDLSPDQGFYRTYVVHNYHTLVYAAMMQGNKAKAARTAQDMLRALPEQYVEQHVGIIDGYTALPYEVHMRFGEWSAMLAEPPPEERFHIATALWRFARAVSLSARGDVVRAREEEKQFADVASAMPTTAMFRRTAAGDLLGVARNMLEGEILYREGKRQEAVDALRKAVKREDKLHYGEPPLWILPVRHALGAVLVDSERYVEAESVYRDDLRRYPENGWALHGLAKSLEGQGKAVEAEVVKERFQKAWRYADTKIASSCLCVKGGKRTEHVMPRGSGE